MFGMTPVKALDKTIV